MVMSMSALSFFEHSECSRRAIRHWDTQGALGHSAFGHLSHSGTRALKAFKKWGTWALRALKHLGTQAFKALRHSRSEGTRALAHSRHFI